MLGFAFGCLICTWIYSKKRIQELQTRQPPRSFIADTLNQVVQKNLGSMGVPTGIQGGKTGSDINSILNMLGAAPKNGDQFPGVAAKRPSTNVVSVSECDNKWQQTPYDLYLQGFTNRVQVQWNRILAKTTNAPRSGDVTVKLILLSNGTANIRTVENTSDEEGRNFATSSVILQSGQSWSPQMIDDLGFQEVTLIFSYP